MSEYQYYEYLAVDHPLSVSDQKALRSISTRAEITSTSFTNHYEWGDLKANPINLLKRYFDVFIYFANWGAHRLALKLPSALLIPAHSKESSAVAVTSNEGKPIGYWTFARKTTNQTTGKVVADGWQRWQQFGASFFTATSAPSTSSGFFKFRMRTFHQIPESPVCLLALVS